MTLTYDKASCLTGFAPLRTRFSVGGIHTERCKDA
jgi:hypothetical protein